MSTPMKWAKCPQCGEEMLDGHATKMADGLEGAKKSLTETQLSLVRVVAQRDELLAACKAVHKCYFLHSEYPRICEQVDAAITKAEGGAK